MIPVDCRNTKCNMKSLTPILLLLSCFPPAASGAAAVEPTLRWASTGGGWRSQFACVGFANLFGRLDILSKFSAISTTSGASWFSTQLFYSRQFYDAVVRAEDSEALSRFVADWMGAYSEMLTNAIEEGGGSETYRNATEHASACEDMDRFDSAAKNDLLKDMCHIMIHFDGDWARFVDEMLVATSESYGDAEFPTRVAGSANRLEELGGTDLLIQSALTPNSRIRGGDGGTDTAVYVGPSATEIYAVPVTAAYVVDASGTEWRYDHNLQGDMTVGTSPTPSQHLFSDWEDFYLYPGKDGTVEISAKGHTKESTDIFQDRVRGEYPSSIARRAERANDKVFSPAFGGGDSTVVQVAATSSAAMGTKSPAAPSVFTQDQSRKRYGIEHEGRSVTRNAGGKVRAFDNRVAGFYSQALLHKFAVCSQWPEPCGAEDGMFVDGWIADNPAFAINVGQYHISGGDLGETLKVILTNTNTEWPTDPDDFQYTQILQYFESPLNEDVEPGSFNWPSGMYVPYQSPQIISDFMDASTYNSLIEPIDGSNMTTALLKGTTVDNPVYGVRAGQSVEILIVNVNEPITTYIATPALVAHFTAPLADMTTHIAENEELARRIEAFVEPLSSDGDGEANGNGDVEVPSLSANAGRSVFTALSGVIFMVNLFVVM